MRGYSGSFPHKLDQKGKVSVPTSFRRELGERVVLTQGTDDRYVWLFPLDRWAEMVEKITALPNSEKAKNVRRFLLGSAHEVEVDRVGRIQVPQALREYADIDAKSVMFIGMGDTIEIWEKEKRDKLSARIVKEKNIQRDMEDLGI